jgi:hypothetical protein
MIICFMKHLSQRQKTTIATAFCLVSTLFSLYSQAQHCQWDNNYIRFLSICSAADGSVINNLHVTVLDERKSDRSLFCQLKQVLEDATFNTGVYIPALSYWKVHSSLYVYGFWAEGKNVKVKIEDIDGENNGGFFKTKIIAWDSLRKYPLCTSRFDKTKIKPTKIFLSLKE